jgi:hypothetical protein
MIVSGVNFSRAVFSLLGFYTVEDGTGLIGQSEMPGRRYHSKRYSSTLSLTSAPDGVGWSTLYLAMQIQYIAYQLVNMVYNNRFFSLSLLQMG